MHAKISIDFSVFVERLVDGSGETDDTWPTETDVVVELESPSDGGFGSNLFGGSPNHCEVEKNKQTRVSKKTSNNAKSFIVAARIHRQECGRWADVIYKQLAHSNRGRIWKWTRHHRQHSNTQSHRIFIGFAVQPPIKCFVVD